MDRRDRRADTLGRAARAWADATRRAADDWRRPEPGRRASSPVGGARAALDAYVTYSRELADLGVDYLAAATRLSQELQSQLWEATTSGRSTSTAARRVRPWNQGRERESRRLTVYGPVGGTATGRFLVENTRATVTTISFTVSELVDDVGASITGAVVLRPASLRLEPGEEAAVTVEVLLDEPDFFVAGEPSRAEITAVGRPELDVELVVVPEPGLG